MSRKQWDKPENRICSQLQRLIPSYIQGELAESELLQFETHLRECFSCQEQILETKQLVQQLKKMPEESLTQDFVPEILKRIPADSWKQNASPRFGVRFYSLSIINMAACILLILSGAGLVLYFLGGFERTPKSEKMASRNEQNQPPFLSESISPESKAILQAIDWLKKAQEPSGSWDAKKWGGNENFTVGVTGLALLALLGSEEIPFRSSYKNSMDRAVKYLLHQQNPEGNFGSPCSGSMYNHGIATVALLEVYGLTEDTQVKKPVEQALNHIRSSQNSDGGWGYFKSSTEPANTSISIWQLQALLLANRLGFKNTQINAERGLSWLRTLVDKEGYIGYRKLGDFPCGPEALTAMGAFFLLVNSSKNAEESNEKIRHTLQDIALKEGCDINYYRWYFLAYALHTLKENYSSGWMENLQGKLVKNQVKTEPHCGSWEPNDRWSPAGGRVYATAMATLSLEADHRAARIINCMRGPY